MTCASFMSTKGKRHAVLKVHDQLAQTCCIIGTCQQLENTTTQDWHLMHAE